MCRLAWIQPAYRIRDEQIDWDTVTLIGSGVSSTVYKANAKGSAGAQVLALKVCVYACVGGKEGGHIDLCLCFVRFEQL